MIVTDEAKWPNFTTVNHGPNPRVGDKVSMVHAELTQLVAEVAALKTSMLDLRDRCQRAIDQIDANQKLAPRRGKKKART
jgi:hypothetical protein